MWKKKSTEFVSGYFATNILVTHINTFLESFNWNKRLSGRNLIAWSSRFHALMRSCKRLENRWIIPSIHTRTNSFSHACISNMWSLLGYGRISFVWKMYEKAVEFVFPVMNGKKRKINKLLFEILNNGTRTTHSRAPFNVCRFVFHVIARITMKVRGVYLFVSWYRREYRTWNIAYFAIDAALVAYDLAITIFRKSHKQLMSYTVSHNLFEFII